MTKYIIEKENAEVKTNRIWFNPSDIIDTVTNDDLNGKGEDYKPIAVTNTLDEARKIFDNEKQNCKSRLEHKILRADILRIREITVDENGDETDDSSLDAIDVFAAMIGGYVFSENKKMVDFDLAETYMDDEIQERLHKRIVPYEEQKFFSAYEKEHYKKFGESFVKTYNLEHNAY